MNIPKPAWFILSFVRRYWPLLLIAVTLEFLGHIKQVVYVVGTGFFHLEAMINSIVFAAFIKHTFFRWTLDAYTESENPGEAPSFIVDWNKLEGPAKIKYTLIVLCVLFLGSAWIAASLAK